MTERAGKTRKLGNGTIVAVCLTFVVGMLGMAYAAVPLYEMFCKVTGYGGTTQRVEQASAVILDRKIKVRFDANTGPGLPWTFEPMQRSLQVKVGAENFAYYRATNNSDHAITGSAVFNVTPDTSGAYFNKIECFCFTQQTLKPGQTVEMPVSFFIDPAIVEDHGLDKIDTITLSYTFYPADEPNNVSSSAKQPSTETNLN